MRDIILNKVGAVKSIKNSTLNAIQSNNLAFFEKSEQGGRGVLSSINYDSKIERYFPTLGRFEVKLGDLKFSSDINRLLKFKVFIGQYHLDSVSFYILISEDGGPQATFQAAYTPTSYNNNLYGLDYSYLTVDPKREYEVSVSMIIESASGGAMWINNEEFENIKIFVEDIGGGDELV
ncbi:MAG TPA: hypothetical protein PKD85_16855 [Saprospiraceae bacterium]|nr:hypothetical protein [Saprospiraceae bacterium]